MRSKFVTTVLWTTLETDASGKAHAEIELPDNLTTFRILAVATTDGDKAGAAQTEVRVSLPLLVLAPLIQLLVAIKKLNVSSRYFHDVTKTILRSSVSQALVKLRSSKVWHNASSRVKCPKRWLTNVC